MGVSFLVPLCSSWRSNSDGQLGGKCLYLLSHFIDDKEQCDYRWLNMGIEGDGHVGKGQ